MTAPALTDAAELAWLRTRVVELEDELQKAQREARRDPLTGLLNRRGLNDAWWAVQGSYHLALLDLDRFKRINDTLGHEAGDEVLIGVAEALRQYPLAARLGGDELVVVGRMADGPPHSWSVPVAGARLTVTATVGLAPVVYEDLAATLRAADAAMYRAKRARRSSIAAFDPALDARPVQRRPRLRLRDQRPGGVR
ncbi:GGDEF domain-containing protein [Micromonospora yangpuensis]|uniref:Diguanylate cyclase (GGDEF) domain-containing protein n=1 Tax=Micromonospora yangpuensis TaxID=683228 RepID=A0A1C6VDZ3_9ACTN|nr:GGDEF domain-containing protein [Micromonospora yangpuensis]GGM13996.1 hypothetical protein GCM10012279_35240 [Micromonospora yangpuensis]SCL64465.1 diguanylate cyclase (GGDEF) domain-containing protein [Micromonospora yangpuensis]